MAKWNSGICEINRIHIHYTRTGGDKRPLLLLHGLMTNGTCWTPVARALEDEYDVIMPDARGHGKSTKSEDACRYEDHADDMSGLIKRLGLSNPVVIGHSMGGMTATLVAYRMQSILRGVILAEPPFFSPEIQRKVYESDVANQHLLLLNKSFDDILRESQKKHPHRTVELLQFLASARLQTSMGAFHVLKPPYPEYKQLVSAIHIPSLVLISERGVIPPLVAEELERLNTRLTVQKVAGVGHGLHYDNPEKFVALVKSFLRLLL